MTYLVTITYAGAWEDVYVNAKDEVEAVSLVRATLPAKVARWANVFVG